MGILDNLKKKSKKDTGVVLKAGVVLLLENQQQFNKLASMGNRIPEIDINLDDEPPF